MEGYIAVVTMVAYDFAPRNWAYCNGQILPIAQNQALFSLLGTTYGGNGVTTFALPNLQSRVPVGVGQGPGMSNYVLGQQSGTENETMDINEMPVHTHNGPVNLALGASTAGGVSTNSEGKFIGSGMANSFSTTSNADFIAPTYSGITLSNAGSSQPYSLLSPYLAVNYVICLYGIFPSRN